MLTLVLLSAMLVIGVIGAPPVMIQQPVESETLFKVSPNVDRQKAFELPCEADGDPFPE